MCYTTKPYVCLSLYSFFFTELIKINKVFIRSKRKRYYTFCGLDSFRVRLSCVQKERDYDPDEFT